MHPPPLAHDVRHSLMSPRAIRPVPPSGDPAPWQELFQRLRRAGLRPTTTRARVLSWIEAHDAPATQDELYLAMQGDCSFGTISRTLTELVRVQLVRRHRSPSRRLYFLPVVTSARVMVVCRHCGVARALDADLLGQRLALACEIIGFNASALELSATCNRCQALG